MSRLAIRGEGILRHHGTVLAVDRLDLRVPEGSVFGFLGPNGAGKTTTIRLLLGLLDPHGGDLEVLGRPMPAARGQILREVGALVEMPSLYPHLTGRENLEITRRLKRCPASAVARALEAVRLEDAADRPVRTYSLGMRQRLGLGLALLGDPKLLILDEPTNGLDPAGIREVRELLRELPRRSGTTVFLSSHLLGEVELIATHLAVLDRGRLRFQGSLGDLQALHRPQLRIETPERERARAALTAEGILAEPQADGALLLPAESHAAAAAINARLVGLGIPVHHLALVRPTLEGWFLDGKEAA